MPALMKAKDMKDFLIILIKFDKKITYSVDANDEDPRPPISPRGKGKQPVQSESGRSTGRCLKLNNNSITNLESLIEFAKIKFVNWQDIAWIDLSHNELTKIGPVSILKMKSITLFPI